MEKSVEEAKKAIQKCYPNLLQLLPISELIERFYSLELLSHDRKSKLDSLTSPEGKIKYFLDEMLIPGLNIGYTGHFDAMITMMKESDDVLTRRLCEKLLPDVAVAASASIPLSTDASNKNECFSNTGGCGIYVAKYLNRRVGCGYSP